MANYVLDMEKAELEAEIGVVRFENRTLGDRGVLEHVLSTSPRDR